MIMGRKQPLIDLLLLAFMYFFLLSYFEPHLLLTPSITTGGDTASHYYTAQYLRDYLLPRGKISGWCQGNLAGFPILQNYFPLPFLLMAVFSWIIPLPIAFKLVTVLGIFLLPLCAYLFFRFLKQPFPIPILGAIFTIPFLFIESNSMWGGNIPSTLAGTFCYSLGFALLIVWLGLLYHTFTTEKGLIPCTVLLALIGFCHGYTLLLGVAASAFFLFFPQRFGLHLKKLLQIHLGAFFLMGIWIVPLLAFLPYTTRYTLLWSFSGWQHFLRDVLPLVSLPFVVLTLIGTLWWVRRSQKSGPSGTNPAWLYIWYLILCGFGLYAVGTRLGLVDIRFLPLSQFFLIITGAMAVSLWRAPAEAKTISVCLVLLLTLLWVNQRETYIHDWIRWNYSGFEKKQLWPAFQKTNHFLTGSPQDPRVVYEHSPLYNRAGTVRAFESLPLFSGRSTLEGVYFQASLATPFIFYLQSEISQNPSMPFHEYNYSRFNLPRALEHFKLFNVKQWIVVEEKTKKQVQKQADLRHRFRAPPFEIYEHAAHSGGYVEALSFKPVLMPSKNWRRRAYQWYRTGDLSVPLVFKPKIDPTDRDRFIILEDPDSGRVPKIALPSSAPIKETIKAEEVLIENAPIGQPLLIKISYHPNWHVEGADQIYLVSPAFMLIYATSSTVRLYYGRTWPDLAGGLLTGLALVLIFLGRFQVWQKVDAAISRGFARLGWKVMLACMLAAAISGFVYIHAWAPESPVAPYNKGLKHFSQRDYAQASKIFKNILIRHPQTSVVDQAGYYYGLGYFLQKKWHKSIDAFRWLLANYPETRRAAEVRYHIGLSYLKTGRIDAARAEFQKTMAAFPESMWATYARDRLEAIGTD